MEYLLPYLFQVAKVDSVLIACYVCVGALALLPLWSIATTGRVHVLQAARIITAP